MDGQSQLGAFLQARRSRLRPDDIGLKTYGDRRRVPGLRREELALLAGVSASYYTRLEQGQSHNASPAVLDALARALGLDESERRHLHDLGIGAASGRKGLRRPPPEHLGTATRHLLDALAGVPAVVLGRRTDVLAWNALGHALFAAHLPADGPDQVSTRPNMAALVFLDPDMRALYADWESKARSVVANLREVAGRHPEDARLASLIGELSMKSPEFSAMWAAHQVRACDAAPHTMHHPLIGALTVTQQALRTGDDQSVVVAHTAPGSPSRAALALLADRGAPVSPRPPQDQRTGPEDQRTGPGRSAAGLYDGS
ncbi:helix-turn-helix transcriptional regulator [Streptomyces aureocirculatus]|uniref:helix-turn-helix transcriptional regulator n=1 Tax=Streptomyces aureocirculatus TaxID=67275 RepID=UPI000690A4DE|nr:helix-turn-helix transcriptional regulator [Streptomyces aureocirculatus]